MTDGQSNTALLPDGLRDNLPPNAAYESGILGELLAVFTAHGYERVDPPLVEFEESLLVGAGEGLNRDTFRLMDPVSQRMMGLRADMTPQIARIATHRLGKSPRPLRLAYSGYVLRVGGSQLKPERQFRQAGVELVGAEESAADAEVILLAYDALVAVGADNLSVDITLPTLVSKITDTAGMPESDRDKLRVALDRKDTAAIASIDGDAASLIANLLAAGGPAEEAMAEMALLTTDEAVEAEYDRLLEVLAIVGERAPSLSLTIDFVENRGFEYHTGLSFTFFARGVRGELGCGGRYCAGDDGEQATGFSLFLHNLMGAVPPPLEDKRIFLPVGTKVDVVRRLQEDGWITVAGLAEVSDVASEAERLRCSHYFDGDTPVAAGKDGEK